MATRWRWPPESCAGRRSSSGSSCRMRATSSTRSFCTFRLPWRSTARTRCSRAPSCADRARRTGTPSRCRALRGRRVGHIEPPMQQSPSVIASRPAIIRSSVDLPQPDGPSRAVKEPLDGKRQIADRRHRAVSLGHDIEFDMRAPIRPCFSPVRSSLNSCRERERLRHTALKKSKRAPPAGPPAPRRREASHRRRQTCPAPPGCRRSPSSSSHPGRPKRARENCSRR